MIDLVLLPGMDGTGLLFSRFVAAMGTRVNPILLHYPRDSSLGYAQLQDYVQRQLPRAGPYVLLGESFSGPIAIKMAAQYPQNIQALILSCSFTKNPQPILAALKPVIGLLPDIRKSKLAMWALLGNHSTPEVCRDFAQVLNEIPMPVLKARLQAVSEVDVTDELRHANMPILYLRAMRDRVVPTSASQHIKYNAKRTQITDIDGPHMLLQTEPELAAQNVLAFLKKAGLLQS